MLKSVGTEVGEFVYTGNISIELHSWQLPYWFNLEAAMVLKQSMTFPKRTICKLPTISDSQDVVRNPFDFSSSLSWWFRGFTLKISLPLGCYAPQSLQEHRQQRLHLHIPQLQNQSTNLTITDFLTQYSSPELTHYTYQQHKYNLSQCLPTFSQIRTSMPRLLRNSHKLVRLRSRAWSIIVRSCNQSLMRDSTFNFLFYIEKYSGQQTNTV